MDNCYINNSFIFRTSRIIRTELFNYSTNKTQKLDGAQRIKHQLYPIAGYINLCI